MRTPAPQAPQAPPAPHTTHGRADTSAPPYCAIRLTALSDYATAYGQAPQRGPRGRHRIATCALDFHAGPLAGAQIAGITVYATAQDGAPTLSDWRATMPAQIRTLTGARITLAVLRPQPGHGTEVLAPLERQAVRAAQDAMRAHFDRTPSTPSTTTTTDHP